MCHHRLKLGERTSRLALLECSRLIVVVAMIATKISLNEHDTEQGEKQNKSHLGFSVFSYKLFCNRTGYIIVGLILAYENCGVVPRGAKSNC
jgi:hypothetical protein